MDQYHLSFRRLKAASAPLDSISRFFRLTRKTRLGRLNEGASGEFGATTAPTLFQFQVTGDYGIGPSFAPHHNGSEKTS